VPVLVREERTEEWSQAAGEGGRRRDGNGG